MRLFLKIGIPPIHLWLITILNRIRPLTLLFIFTIHKLLPLLFLRKLIIRPVIVVMLVITRVTLFLQSSLLIIYFMSSIVHTFWIRLSLITNNLLFIFYWAGYSLLRAGFVVSIFSKRNPQYNSNSLTSVRLLILGGIPPTLVFWLKAELTVQFIILSTIISIIILSTSLLNLVSYLHASFRLISSKDRKALNWLAPGTLFTRLCVLTT